MHKSACSASVKACVRISRKHERRKAVRQSYSGTVCNPSAPWKRQRKGKANPGKLTDQPVWHPQRQNNEDTVSQTRWKARTKHLRFLLTATRVP